VREAWSVKQFGGSGRAGAERRPGMARIRSPRNEPRRGVEEFFFAERHRVRILSVDVLPWHGGINIRAIAPASSEYGVEASP
jgi:hypothetical protein